MPILFEWDWNPQISSREGSGSLGNYICIYIYIHISVYLDSLPFVCVCVKIVTLHTKKQLLKGIFVYISGRSRYSHIYIR